MNQLTGEVPGQFAHRRAFDPEGARFRGTLASGRHGLHASQENQAGRMLSEPAWSYHRCKL